MKMFAQLHKTPIEKAMPFSLEIGEHTKRMALDTFINSQLKKRDEKLAVHPDWSREKLEGYLQGLIDMALDVKLKLKELDGG